MTNINGILLVYHRQLGKNAPTIDHHVNAFNKYSQFNVWSVNTALKFPTALDHLRFNVIVFHYSLFGLPINLGDEFLQFIKDSPHSYKIVFLQDEHRYWPQRSEFINKYGIDCVYSLLEARYFDETYLKRTKVSKVFYNLPGYVSREMVEAARQYAKPDTERKMDVGYRGRRLPYYMGRGSQEKHLIGIEFKKRAAPFDLHMDIETEEDKRIYGKAWPRFLGNCKAVLGVETGVSVFDIDNVVRPEYEKRCRGHPDTSYPDCSFEEFHDAVLAPHEDKIFYRTIGPRHFEAAAFRTCQILFDGKYSDILKPLVHYIPLRKDFSNFSEVVSMFRNDQLRRELTENAYRDLVEAGTYSYESFIHAFDQELISAGFSPQLEEKTAKRVTDLLNRGGLQRYLRGWLIIIRHMPFTGRNFLRPLFKPLFKKLGI